jgi:hypothetical protein
MPISEANRKQIEAWWKKQNPRNDQVQCQVCNSLSHAPKDVIDLPTPGGANPVRAVAFACQRCGCLWFVDAAAIGLGPS